MCVCVLCPDGARHGRKREQVPGLKFRVQLSPNPPALEDRGQRHNPSALTAIGNVWEKSTVTQPPRRRPQKPYPSSDHHPIPAPEPTCRPLGNTADSASVWCGETNKTIRFRLKAVSCQSLITSFSSQLSSDVPQSRSSPSHRHVPRYEWQVNEDFDTGPIWRECNARSKLRHGFHTEAPTRTRRGQRYSL